MEKCIVCNSPFRISGNWNKNKQLTCRKPTCQRALKTMRQHWRRSQARTKKEARKK